MITLGIKNYINICLGLGLCDGRRVTLFNCEFDDIRMVCAFVVFGCTLR